MLARPLPRLVWNASASAPLGLYWLAGGPVSRGDFVLAALPDSARRLAAERGYLSAGVPLVKRVAASGGDTVCAVATTITITIDGDAVAARLAADSRGRPLPAWAGCQVLRDGEFFLLMPDVPDSFDSRYFGPVAASSIIGRLVPLWTW
jgi:conjugative transfer signal peptidase TraF